MTAKISLDAIKALRNKTGAAVGDVRKALEAAGGDEHKAQEWLKQKGLESAQKREGRATTAGRVDMYVHHDGRVGALVEIDCETDFVARTPDFQQFCRDVAMQVASQQPVCIKPEELPAGSAKEQALLEQPFIKDSKHTIGSLLTTLISKTGENVAIRRFVRFGVGEESGK